VLRYLDDIPAMWPHGETKLNTFLNHLSELKSVVKFAIETERYQMSLFLGVLVDRKQ
jgi:hypothetical protein